MMSSNKNDWLTLLSSNLEFNSSFLHVFEQKLVEHAKVLANVNLRSGKYGLVPPDSGFKVEYRQRNSLTIASLEGYLVDANGLGHPVTAIWYSPIYPDRGIDPQMEISEDYQLQVLWVEFPIDELRSYNQQTKTISEIIPEELDFKVEYGDIAWPDIHLKLQSYSTYEQAEVFLVEGVIDQTISGWDKKHKENNKGTVHYRSESNLIAPNKLYIHIDFGSADKKVLSVLLRNLNDMIKPNFLEKVIIHS